MVLGSLKSLVSAVAEVAALKVAVDVLLKNSDCFRELSIHSGSRAIVLELSSLMINKIGVVTVWNTTLCIVREIHSTDYLFSVI